MKIAVIGATGKCGHESARIALERGWQVVAVVRNPDKMLDFTHENLEVSSEGGICILHCLSLPPPQLK